MHPDDLFDKNVHPNQLYGSLETHIARYDKDNVSQENLADHKHKLVELKGRKK